MAADCMGKLHGGNKPDAEAIKDGVGVKVIGRNSGETPYAVPENKFMHKSVEIKEPAVKDGAESIFDYFATNTDKVDHKVSKFFRIEQARKQIEQENTGTWTTSTP